MEGLDLSDRIDERKIARNLNLSEEEAAEFGFQNGDEPVLYDLCTSVYAPSNKIADSQMLSTTTSAVSGEVITLLSVETRSTVSGTTMMTREYRKPILHRSR